MWKFHYIAYSLFGLSSHKLNKANDRKGGLLFKLGGVFIGNQ